MDKTTYVLGQQTSLFVMALEFWVDGVPAPQGSKNGYPIYRGSKAKGTRQFTGKVRMVESSAKVKPWREAVEIEARRHVTAEDGWEIIMGPCVLRVDFHLHRPKRPKHPAHPITYPDVSKLARSTEDALTAARVWGDDAMVVQLMASKRFATDEKTGASIYVYRMLDM